MLDLTFMQTLQALSPSTVVLIAAVLLLVYLAFPSAQDRAVAHLPKPDSTLPILANTIDAMITKRAKLHDFIADECKKNNGKPWVLKVVGRAPMVVLYTVEHMEDVFKKQFETFIKGQDLAKALRDLFGDGIFAVDGEKWYHQRKTASHLFSMQMMRDVMDDVIVSHTEQLCDVIGNAAKAGKEVDMKHLLELFTTDVFMKIGFGVDLKFLTEDNHEFFERFGRVSHILLYRNEQPMWWWQMKQLLSLGVEKQQKEDIKWIDTFVFKIIADSIANKHAGVANPNAKDLITLFLEKEENDRGDHELDAKAIRDMAMAFISAGRDTTAYGMSWFMIMMARHPEVQEKIRQELWEKIPDLMTGKVKAPSKDQIGDLVYLEAALKESLRINPVIPINSRMAKEDTTLSDGTFLKAGTAVVIPAYAMARMKFTWGPDAEEYNPERWIDPQTGKILPISPFKFMTFSAGPRICLGNKFSIMEMKMTLSAILSKYVITTTKDPHSYEYDTTLALGVIGPIMVKPTFVPKPAAKA